MENPAAKKEKPTSKKAKLEPWTADLNVKLLLAYINATSTGAKVEWSAIAKDLGRTGEGVRQQFKKLRRITSESTGTPKTGQDGTPTPAPVASKKAKTSASNKKRAKDEQYGSEDDSEQEEMPRKKRATKLNVFAARKVKGGYETDEPASLMESAKFKVEGETDEPSSPLGYDIPK